MATVTFIKYQKQSTGALRGVTGYVSQKQKTEQEDGWQLVSGQNCTPQLAAQEFIATRQMHRKDSPVWFYHYVQSFSPNEKITGALAHQVAREFAEQAWPDSEVLIATHIDAEHIHSHFIVNAVCYASGKMLRQGPNTLSGLRTLSDGLCLKYSLSVLPKQQQRKAKGMSSREYRSAAKGESWKFRLINAIDQCMRYASTREEFISLMESEGYQVRWTDSRKNITYTTPTGMKCRDDRLHDQRYTKEVMEYEFRIRAALAHGGIEAAERDTNPNLSQQRGVAGAAPSAGRAGAAHSGPYSPSTGGFQPEGAVPRPSADGGTDARCGGSTAAAATGWEEERALYLSAQFENSNVGRDMAGPDPAGHYGGHGGLAGDLVRLGRSLERDQAADPVRDATTMHQHTDRKVLLQEQELKIAMGHREDDHEEELTWKQSM
mgnify:CR=1 FL=1